MQCKLCLVLALAVLLGSLAVGNPFLGGNGAVALRAPAPSLAESSTPASGAALAAVPAAAPAVANRGDASPLPAPGTRDGRKPAVAAPAALLPECPDPALRPLVVRIAVEAGAPVWVLRDGRCLRRNPKSGPGQPLLVPVVLAGGSGDDAGDEGDDPLPEAETASDAGGRR